MIDSPTTAWLNGRFVPWPEAVLPIEDRGLQFGESVYEVFPVTAARPRLVAEHCQRMRRGAEAIGIERGLPDCAALEEIASELISREGLREGLIYAQVTGGSAPRSHLAVPPAHFFAYLRSHQFPRAPQVNAGMTAVTLVDERWAGRNLKTTMLLPAVLAKRQAAAKGADEAILVSATGEVHEGASSNIFVVAGSELLHPAASRHLLAGTMAPLVVSFARELGLEVRPTRLQLTQLYQADECICSATSRLAMPFVEVDGHPIGNGTAGPVVQQLAQRMRDHFELADGELGGHGAGRLDSGGEK